MSEIQRLQIECARWANETFGINRSPHGAISHLAREVKELAERPFDHMEYVDCLTLLLDAASNAGLRIDDLISDSWDKLNINRHREWGDQQEDGTIEHIRNPK